MAMLCFAPSSFRKVLNVLSMSEIPCHLHHSWCSKARENHFIKHLPCMLGVSSSTCQCFHPFRYVVDGDKDVLADMGLLEWPHEVNTQDIEYLHMQVVMEGHGIASSDATLELTLLTPSNEFFGVFVHRWPEEPALPDFGLCAEYSIMSSVRCCLAILDVPHSFHHGYASLQ